VTDILKLTAYLAERERHGGRFLTEELLDLFGERRVATSILLRGIASFGPRDIVRTDETLSMSEDLPVTIAAADTPEVIGPLVDEVAARIGRGLLTVERARLVDGAFPPAVGGDSVRTTLYVGRQQRIDGVAAHVAACDIFHRLGFAGAIVYLGVDGTVRGDRRRARFFSRNIDVPVMVLAVGTAEQAEAAAAELSQLIPQPFLTVERIRVCKQAGRLIDRPHALPATASDGLALAQKLMVFTVEDARHDGQPIHRALVRRLRQSNHSSGATVLRGLWGFSGNRPPHGDRMWTLGRSVPVGTIMVDAPGATTKNFEIVDALTAEQGLVTCEMVPAMVAIDGDDRRGGTRLARHHY
jgi:PII-like signaling protein